MWKLEGEKGEHKSSQNRFPGEDRIGNLIPNFYSIHCGCYQDKALLLSKIPGDIDRSAAKNVGARVFFQLQEFFW